MALAPSLPLLAVPSSWMRNASIAAWSLMSMAALMSAGAITSLTFATALWTPGFEPSARVLATNPDSRFEKSKERGRSEEREVDTER